MSFHHLRFMQKPLPKLREVNTGEMNVGGQISFQTGDLKIKTDYHPLPAVYIQSGIESVNSVQVKIICKNRRVPGSVHPIMVDGEVWLPGT